MINRCLDIFNPKEQGILKKYRKENFAPKVLNYGERRAIGKCPLTPEEVIFLLVTSLQFVAGNIFFFPYTARPKLVRLRRLICYT